MKGRMVFFGEAEKGEYHTLLRFTSLVQFADVLGNPPIDSQGMFLAIQSLLFSNEVIYIRVKEEGYSLKDYHKGLALLKDKDNIKELKAIGIPGVGDQEIIEESSEVCHMHRSLLIVTERDFYDYITGLSKNSPK